MVGFQKMKKVRSTIGLLTYFAADIGQRDVDVADFVLHSEVDHEPRVSSVFQRARPRGGDSVYSEACW